MPHISYFRLTPLIALLLVCFTQHAAAAQEVITVHYQERPPYYLTENETLSGIIGERVKAVFDHAGVPYRFANTPIKRQLLLLEDNRGLDCLVGLFHTPDRARYANFSRPIYRDGAQMILARTDNPRFSPLPRLTDLLANRKPILLIKNDSSYGESLDIMMARYVPRIITTATNNESMIRMIHAGRADYMFIAAPEAETAIAKAGVNADDLLLAVLPGTPKGNKRYLLFSKKVSPSVINRINKSIVTLFSPDARN